MSGEGQVIHIAQFQKIRTSCFDYLLVKFAELLLSKHELCQSPHLTTHWVPHAATGSHGIRRCHAGHFGKANYGGVKSGGGEEEAGDEKEFHASLTARNV